MLRLSSLLRSSLSFRLSSFMRLFSSFGLFYFLRLSSFQMLSSFLRMFSFLRKSSSILECHHQSPSPPPPPKTQCHQYLSFKCRFLERSRKGHQGDFPVFSHPHGFFENDSMICCHFQTTCEDIPVLNYEHNGIKCVTCSRVLKRLES